MKAGAFQWASKYGICLLIPDTSPRDVNCEGDRESWDFGEGAGFYLNATSPLYSKHYNMYSYIEEELSNAIKQIDSIANQVRSLQKAAFKIQRLILRKFPYLDTQWVAMVHFC